MTNECINQLRDYEIYFCAKAGVPLSNLIHFKTSNAIAWSPDQRDCIAEVCLLNKL